jgi:xylulokinase
MPVVRCAVGLDVGTTSIKAMAVAEDGSRSVPVAEPTPTTRDAGGVAEHDPEALWAAVARCTTRLMDRLPGGWRVSAVAPATVGEAGVALDAGGRELHPIIAWHDRRALPYALRWRQDPGEQEIYALTGLTVDGVFTVNKLLWLRDRRPEVFSRARRWLSMQGWLLYRLAGVAATAPSIAARTMLFDRIDGEWSQRMLDAADVDASLLPDVVPSGTEVGALTEAAAGACGLPAGIAVVAGGHDHLCGAYAVRGGDPGVVVDSVGTAESLVASISAPLRGDPGLAAHINCYPGVERGRWVLSAQVGLAGGLVGWALERLYGETPGVENARRLFERLPPHFEPGGVLCVPQLGRGASPRWDPEAALGAFAGLGPETTREDLVRALLEATCFSLRENLEWFGRHAGATTRIAVIGGAARNEAWLQMRADVTGRTLEVPEVDEPAALGAALLAAAGAGLMAGPAVAASLPVIGRRRIEPDPRRSAGFDRRFVEGYLPLVDALRPIHRRLNAGLSGEGLRG